MAKLTVQQQANLLGVGKRYVYDLRERGLPAPKPGEAPSRWSKRAQKWMDAHVQPKGAGATTASQDGDPEDPESQAHFTRRWRKARALREELALRKELGEVHDRAPCHAEQAKRFGVLMRHFLQMPMELGRSCAGQGAEAITRTATTLLQSAFAELQQALAVLPTDDRTAVHAGDAAGPDVAGDDGAKPLGRHAQNRRRKQR